MKMALQATSIGLILVVVLTSTVFAGEKEPAVRYHFVNENKETGQKADEYVWVNLKGTKFQMHESDDEGDAYEAIKGQRITYFNGERPGMYDIDLSNNTHRIFDRRMVEQQMRMMENMRAQFGMEQNAPMQRGGAGGANQDISQKLQQAQEKIRQAKLEALEKAKKKGNLTPEEEREWRSKIGGPSGSSAIKKTGKSQKTKWGSAFEYEERQGGMLVERSYVLPWSEVPQGGKAKQVNESMQNFMEDIQKGFPQMKDMTDEQPDMFEEGLPVITEEYESERLVRVTTFSGATRQDFVFGPSDDSIEESMMSPTVSRKKRRRQFDAPPPGYQDQVMPEGMYEKEESAAASDASQEPPGNLQSGAADALRQLQKLFGGQ